MKTKNFPGRKNRRRVAALERWRTCRMKRDLDPSGYDARKKEEHTMLVNNIMHSQAFAESISSKKRRGTTMQGRKNK